MTNNHAPNAGITNATWATTSSPSANITANASTASAAICHPHCCSPRTPTADPAAPCVGCLMTYWSGCLPFVCLQERGFPSSSRLSRSTPTPSPPPTVTAAQRSPTPPQTLLVSQNLLSCLIIQISTPWRRICMFSWRSSI